MYSESGKRELQQLRTTFLDIKQKLGELSQVCCYYDDASAASALASLFDVSSGSVLLTAERPAPACVRFARCVAFFNIILLRRVWL